MEAKKFENPKSRGDIRRILERFISVCWSFPFIPGKNKGERYGMRKNAIATTKIIKRKNALNILSIKLFKSSPFSFFSVKKGTSIEIDTSEATVTNIRSGILNAA